MSVGIVVVLLVTMPPTGVPNDNEYHYISIAAYSVDPDSVYGSGSLEMLGGSQHTFIFSTAVGYGLSALGVRGMQIAGNIAVLFLFAWALSALFARLGLSLIDAMVVLVGFIALGQEILGGEWLFGGFEPKTIAYPLVIIAIVRAMEARFAVSAAWLGAATYFHFLVAGLWFGFVALWLLAQRRPLTALVRYAGVYVLISLPVLLLVIASYSGHLEISEAGDLPAVSWIYSNFRMSHHVAPFADRWTLLNWLPGIALLIGISIAMSLLLMSSETDRDRLGLLVMIVLLFLLSALALATADREGWLGPLNLFRPSSLALLLFLTVVAGMVTTRMQGRAAPLVKMAVLVIVSSMSIPALMTYVVEPTWAHYRSEPEKRQIAAYVSSNTPAGAVFLMHQDLERDFFDFETRTSRPLLVLYKFIPTTRDGIREWYRRIIFRDAVFSEGCSEPMTYRIDYLVVPTRYEGPALESCGDIVFSSPRYTVLSRRVGR